MQILDSINLQLIFPSISLLDTRLLQAELWRILLCGHALHHLEMVRTIFAQE